MDGSKLKGISPAATIKTDVNGGLWYDPIPGDMLRTYETTPQVTAQSTLDQNILLYMEKMFPTLSLLSAKSLIC